MLRGSAAAPVGHGHDILAMLEGLVEVANVTRHILVSFNRQWYHRNKAEGEPRVALDHMAGHVATVMALAYETLIAGNLFAKGVFAARKKEEHGEDRWAGAS
jgi:hypothetical protein